MVEFRWLILHHNDNDGTHPSAIQDSMPGYFRVLQFREEKGPVGERRWSEWRDIPTIDA